MSVGDRCVSWVDTNCHNGRSHSSSVFFIRNCDDAREASKARGGDGGSGPRMHDCDGVGGNQMAAAEGGGEILGNQMHFQSISKDFE